MALVYLDKVTSNRAAFEQKVIQIAGRLGIQADWLMIVMYAESKLNHLAQNPSSSAIGLIQFLDKTLANLGTNRTQIQSMSNIQQLDYVEKYFVYQGMKGKMKSVYDVCLAVFLPKYVGAADSTIIAKAGTNTYNANKGMDMDKDGILSVGDVKSWYGKYVPANVATGSNTVDVTLILTGIAVLYLLYQWSNTKTTTTLPL